MGNRMNMQVLFWFSRKLKRVIINRKALRESMTAVDSRPGKIFLQQPVFTIVMGGCILLAACQGAEDSVRNWGERQGRDRIQPLDEREIQRWKRDLDISDSEIQELNRRIQELVQESNHKGQLSRRIGKAYMDAGRYEMATMHYGAALEDEMFDERQLRSIERSVPHYREALARHNLEPELVFEAGLAFANAAVNLGWEDRRLNTAIYLFERHAELKPEDHRPRYQLALIYGKTANSDYFFPDRSISMLEDILLEEPDNVPVRFARAHILAENGQWDFAIDEYRTIRGVLEDMHGRGQLPGNVRRNPQYIQAGENLEKLQACITGEYCEIMVR